MARSSRTHLNAQTPCFTKQKMQAAIKSSRATPSALNEKPSASNEKPLAPNESPLASNEKPSALHK